MTNYHRVKKAAEAAARELKNDDQQHGQPDPDVVGNGSGDAGVHHDPDGSATQAAQAEETPAPVEQEGQRELAQEPVKPDQHRGKGKGKGNRWP